MFKLLIGFTAGVIAGKPVRKAVKKQMTADSFVGRQVHRGLTEIILFLEDNGIHFIYAPNQENNK